MGAVTHIKSSRKSWTCGKCGRDINPGDSYFRGEVNFGPIFIRCTTCGLKPYEVTTSEYIRTVGELLDTWDEKFGKDETGVESLREVLEDIQAEQQDKLDNMPYQLQESSSGLTLQDRIDGIERAIDELDLIDVDDMKSDAVDEISSNYDDEYPHLSEGDISYDAILDSDEYSHSLKDDLVSAFEGYVFDAMQSAIDEIEW